MFTCQTNRKAFIVFYIEVMDLKQLILASSSPRRQQLLKELGLSFHVEKPEIDESAVSLPSPNETVKRLAQLKAQKISLNSNNETVLAADTIVVFEGTIFEKPKNREDALQMMRSLSGNTHDVITAVAIRSLEKEIVFSVRTTVEFWPLSEEEIHAYISTDEPYDKAGAYGIQGLARIFIKKIDGDYYNVVGLPISYVIRELRNFGINVNQYVFHHGT